MNFVEPIRDPYVIAAIMKHLKAQNERNHIMFILGIYSGLRISDILKLQVKHIHNNEIRIREQKTGKQRTIPLHKHLKKPLKDYIEDKDEWEFIIKSREGTNKPISRSMAYKIIKELEDYFQVEAIGTHTLRKTFGYHYYKGSRDVATLQKIFNHSHPNETLRYIGIIQDDINDAIKSFKFYEG